MPLLSVILPVYNTEAYIGEAIQSILEQTFTDFELIIIDDCSTDKTVSVAQSFNDNRISIHINKLNRGRAFCDNKGHCLATGEFFAKMDGDDICQPQRFEKQVQYLQSNPQINTVGSAIKSFGSSTYLHRYPETPEETRAFTLFTLPAANNAVIFRSSLFTEKKLIYNETLRQSEDYDFCARYLQELSIANLKDVLIRYRNFPVKTKDVVFKNRHAAAQQVRVELLRRWGIISSKEQAYLHNLICHLQEPVINYKLKDIEEWLQYVLSYNKRVPWFDEQALASVVAKRWFEVCYHYPYSKLSSMRNYYKSNLKKFYTPNWYSTGKFIVKAIGSF